MIPHCRRAEWSGVRPGSLAAAIRADDPAGCAVALLGVPDDTGVVLNGGRPGARGGPRAFRNALARYGTGEPAGWRWPGVFDAGDVVVADDLDETHRRVEAATAALLALGLLPVAIGGGHDLTLPFLRAVAARHPGLVVTYLDAHLDVRPERGSGMAFRRLLEEGHVAAAHVHGLDRFATQAAHLEWFEAHGGRVHSDAGPPALPDAPHQALSIDLDVLDAAVAPGVSAMNPAGWPVARAAAWAALAGRDPRVRALDLMELNPGVDESGRTARVAAHLFLHALAGLAARPGA